jgi:hypothetical protein
MKKPIWYDRKRIFGMPISFTKYRLYEDKLIHSQGFISVTEGELLLYKVLDVEIKFTLSDRIWGVGTIILHTGDITDSTFVIEKVKEPREALDLINDFVDKERVRLGVKGKELYGVNNFHS